MEVRGGVLLAGTSYTSSPHFCLHPSTVVEVFTSFLFWLSPQFRAGKMPFRGLSLLPNSTETLATQASHLPTNGARKDLVPSHPDRVIFALRAQLETLCNGVNYSSNK